MRANPLDGICPICDLSECEGHNDYYYNEGPEFSQEYESPEDVYLEVSDDE